MLVLNMLMLFLKVPQNLYLLGGGKDGPAYSFPPIDTKSEACNNHSNFKLLCIFAYFRITFLVTMLVLNMYMLFLKVNQNLYMWGVGRGERMGRPILSPPPPPIDTKS